jgi:hypothetical protein
MLRALVAATALGCAAPLMLAQGAVRPGGGGAGGGVLPGGGQAGGGQAGGGQINPINPGGGNTTAGLRIVTDTGVLIGETVQATAILQTAAGALPGGGGNAGGGGGAANTTYQWTISGGRITTDSTRPAISFIADTPGTVALNVAVTTAGAVQSSSIEITVISPALAGEITAPATAVTAGAGAAATNLTATVPAAQNADRTFRWAVAGTGAGIVSGQGTNAITVRPGAPGLLEITCDVTLQRLATVTLRSFVVVTGNGPPVGVTLTNGSGGGTYPGGSRVDIFAHPPPTGQVFDRWTGDTAALGTGALAPFLPHTILTVPATPVALTATYKAAATWTPTSVTTFNPQTVTGANEATTTVSTTLAYHVPANATGLVFLLHDTPGNAAEWFNRPEQLLLLRDLVAAGYGVAALNSINRGTGAWAAQTALANNLDALNHIAALEKFARDGVVAATKPVFFLGMGNGAIAAAGFGELLARATPARPVKGTVLYCSAGNETLSVSSRIPQFIALADNDETVGAAGLVTARANAQIMVGRGIATANATSAVSPVHQGRFRALGVNSATFTAAHAQEIWTALKNAGLFDANNYLKSIPTTAALTAALPAAHQTRAADVAAQLGVAFASRVFFSDFNARVINFLNARVAGTPGPTPGRLVNLSTLTKIAYVGDTFALGFNISGAQKATLLIRGIGAGLTQFGLAGALTAPRLEVSRGTTLIAANEGWDKANNAAEIASAAAAVGAFALAPGASDTALLLSLDPGTYNVMIQGLNGASGDVLAEVYDISKNGTRLTNLSTLAKITAEGEFLVPGIVVAGANPRTLVVRAVGPGLTDFGITDGYLGDPRISILNGTGQTVATNNNWAQGGATGGALALTAAFPAVGAFPLKATNSDAALVNALAPGNYTLQAGAAVLPVANPNAPQSATPPVVPSQIGSVLVEVYELN